MNDQKLQKLLGLLRVIDTNVTREDFATAFKSLTSIVLRVETELVKRIDARLAKVKDGKNGRDGKDGAKGDQGDPGPAGEAIQGPPGRDGKDGTPDTADDIRNKLELLPDGEKLAIDAIQDLRKELDALRQDLRGAAQSVIAYSRGQTKLYDLSDQLNGSKKTFALPSFWRVLMVQSTSTPNAFRPTVDYTVDGNAMTITFTDEIDAASTLSAGQTLTVLYAEP